MKIWKRETKYFMYIYDGIEFVAVYCYLIPLWTQMIESSRVFQKKQFKVVEY